MVWATSLPSSRRGISGGPLNNPSASFLAKAGPANRRLRLLFSRLPLLSGVPRTTYALYFSSMFVALGLLYASQSTLLFSTFTLEDQHAFGWILVSVGLVAYLLVLVSFTACHALRSGNTKTDRSGSLELNPPKYPSPERVTASHFG